MPITRINFTSIPVEDQDRAIAFYTGHFGFEVETDAAYGEGWRWVFLQLPGDRVRLHFSKTEELSVSEGHPILTLVSDNVDTDAARWAASGVEVAAGPADAPWNDKVRFALVRDSEGNLVLVESGKADA